MMALTAAPAMNRRKGKLVSAVDPAAEAVAHRNGALLVAAGPGSGKTRIIVARTKALVGEGIPASAIASLTFSNNAAKEMRQRIEEALELSLPQDAPTVTTYHSFAQHIVELFGHQHGWHSPRLATDAEKWLHLAAVLKEIKPKHLYRATRATEALPEIAAIIQRAKQELVTPRQYLEWAQLNISQADRADMDLAEKHLGIAQVYKAFYKRFRDNNIVEHDDHIMIAVQLLRMVDEVQAWVTRYREIQVDEYQDTNLAQAVMVDEMVKHSGANVMVVGDEDQSIYRFRGAASANFERFRRTYPGHREIGLLANHRSQPEIIKVAQSVIDAAQGRTAKTVVPVRNPGEQVRLVICPERQDEAMAIAERCRDLHDGGSPWREICVMFRNHDDLDEVCRALQAADIPYLYGGGRDFFEAPAVRCLVGLLGAIDDPTDSQAVILAMNLPAWRMSARGAVALRKAMQNDPDEPVFDRLEKSNVPGMPDEDAAKGKEMAALILDYAARAQTEDVRQLFFELLGESELLAGVDDEPTIQGKQVNANVRRLMGLLDEYVEAVKSEGVSDAVRYLRLLKQTGHEGLAAIPGQELLDAVRLTTIHAAKGLEFDHVMIGGVAQGRIPSRRNPRRVELPADLADMTAADRADQDLEEERRVLYVGLTRARDTLTLSFAQQYSYRGATERVSDFLAPAADALAIQTREMGSPVVPRARALPAQPADGVIRLSYTLAQAFSDCPRKYLFHLWNAPQAPDVKRWFGVALHDCLKSAAERARAGESVGAEAMVAMWNGRWESLRGKPGRTEELRDEGERCLRAYAESASWKDAELDMVEFSFEVGGEYQQRFGLVYTGKMDRAEKVGDRPRVIDYKSGAEKSEAYLKRDLQRDIYVVGLADHLGIEGDIDFEFVWLAEGTTTLATYTSKDVAKARQRLWAVGRSVKDAHVTGQFPARPSRFRCGACSFASLCEDRHL